MSQENTSTSELNAAARKSLAKLYLSVPEQQRSVSSFYFPTEYDKKGASVRWITKPSHDLSTSMVIDLIEKRLNWIDRTDLHVGLMNCYENNHYDIELIAPDRSPVYYVHVDARSGRFYWAEAGKTEQKKRASSGAPLSQGLGSRNCAR